MRKARLLCLAVAATTAVGLLIGPSGAAGVPVTPASGGDPNGYVIGQQPHRTVHEPAPGVIAGNALVEAFDGVDKAGLPQRQVQLTWQSNEDVASANNVSSMMQSYDGGYTFPSGINSDAASGWYAKLRDGSRFGVEFIPDSVIDTHRVKLITRRSTDGGKTYRRELATFTTDGTFDPTKFDRGVRIHRDLFYAKDGSLLLGYYTTYVGDPGYRSELARSTDNGRTWQRYATVATQTDGRWMGETGMTRAINGDLVAVHRTGQAGGANIGPLYTNRSTDDGRTWTSPVPIKITTASGEPAPATGVMPVLRLLPNGIMTLTWGRPDNWIAISPDGMGTSFEQAQTTYVNYPTVNAAFQRNHGSSGNGAHAAVGSNRVIIAGDNCAPSWGCPETDAGFTVDGEYRVWTRLVDVVAPGVGKIDLLGKYRKEKISVRTDLDARNPKLPEMSPLGAIDGSTDWASSAVGRGRTGTYTLTLDRTYTLTRAGLALHPGEKSKATVEVSVDGTAWEPVVRTGEITSYALKYFDIDGVAAKYVRVRVDDRHKAFLNELELYSTVDSFENDPVGQVPRGYTNAVGATVTDFDTDDSRRMLRLVDPWIDRTSGITWESASAAEQNLEFRVNSIGYARSFSFVTRGADGAPAFQFNVGSDGSIGWYDATTRQWTKLTAAGVAPQKKWHTLRVEATLTSAEVFLNGTSVGTVGPTTPGVTGLAGHSFGTSGTTSQYDHFLIDDVEQTG